MKRATTRYQGNRQVTRGWKSFFGPPETVRSWQEIDTVSGDVTAAHGAETYANIRVNGKPAKRLPSDGLWQSGEFAILLAGILSPNSAAQFTNQRPDPIGNHPSWRYDFAVDQPHSGWHMEAAHRFYSPAYSGSIWIDTETGQVLRFAMSARDVPAAFPMDAAEVAEQHLRIKAFFGTSENAVKTQIWIALSAYVLVAIVRKRFALEARDRQDGIDRHLRIPSQIRHCEYERNAGPR